MKKLLILITVLVLSNNLYAHKAYTCMADAFVGAPEINRVIFRFPANDMNVNYYNAIIEIHHNDAVGIIEDDGFVGYIFKDSFLNISYDGGTFGELYTRDNGENYQGKVVIDEDFTYFLECKSL